MRIKKTAILVAFKYKPGLSNADRIKVQRKLHSYKNKSNRGQYEYVNVGYMNKIKHIMLQRGVYVIRAEDYREMRLILRGKAEVFAREIILTEKDKSVLWP